MSSPSTLPRKSRPLARSNSAACFTTSLPLTTSSPMLSKPTVGRALSSIAETKAAPSSANCSRCSAPQSTLAPRSSTVVIPPFWLGSAVAIAGRSIPSSVFNTKREMAISAPVLPALTTASARPSLTRLAATRIEESRLPRSATATGSSIATTSLAATSSSLERVAPAAASLGSIWSGRPTSSSVASARTRANASSAGTVTAGP